MEWREDSQQNIAMAYAWLTDGNRHLGVVGLSKYDPGRYFYRVAAGGENRYADTLEEAKALLVMWVKMGGDDET